MNAGGGGVQRTAGQLRGVLVNVGVEYSNCTLVKFAPVTTFTGNNFVWGSSQRRRHSSLPRRVGVGSVSLG
jgi:hypothetical protein